MLLQANKSLRALTLRCEKLNHKGVETLEEAVRANSSINDYDGPSGSTVSRGGCGAGCSMM
jgi:hypothetical protein